MHIDRHFDGAELGQRAPDDDVIHRVRQHDENRVTGLDAGIGKPLGQTPGTLVDLADSCRRLIVRQDPGLVRCSRNRSLREPSPGPALRWGHHRRPSLLAPLEGRLSLFAEGGDRLAVVFGVDQVS